jgi:hypothetical protein
MLLISAVKFGEFDFMGIVIVSTERSICCVKEKWLMPQFMRQCHRTDDRHRFNQRRFWVLEYSLASDDNANNPSELCHSSSWAARERETPRELFVPGWALAIKLLC